MARVSLHTVLSRSGLTEGLLGLRLALATRRDAALAPFALRRRPELFADLETLCLFIGYPRSGHSLLGSLIDAHPHALVSHRVDAVGHLQHGRSPWEVFYLMARNSRRFARRGRRLTGYSYDLSDLWQGRAEVLRLVGDQEGRATAERLGANPELRERLARLDGVAVRLLHVVRNPYDTISTMARRTNQDLGYNSERYFALCHDVAAVRKDPRGLEILDVRFETLLADPANGLRRVLDFLRLPAPGGWLPAALSIVRRTPHRSRAEAPWTAELVAAVARRAAPFDFLRGYDYEG